MMSQRSRGACSALRISRMSEASLGSWSRATRTSSSEFCTGMYTLAIQVRNCTSKTLAFLSIISKNFSTRIAEKKKNEEEEEEGYTTDKDYSKCCFFRLLARFILVTPVGGEEVAVLFCTICKRSLSFYMYL